MQEIEKRMNGQAEAAAPQSAADIERDARAMNTLMQAYARVKKLDAQARRALWARVQGADFLTVNEKRAAVGYGALDGGDVLGSGPPP